MCVLLIFLLLVHNGLNAIPLKEGQALDDEVFDLESGLKYLSKFGYNIPQFDEEMEKQLTQVKVEGAIRDFQEFYGLEVTGNLDDDTVELMNTPRCGVKDGQKSANYVLWGSRWDKRSLTYRVSKYSRRLNNAKVDLAVDNAFAMWQEQANISFKKKGSGKADIDIRFEKYRHGDADPFDGPGRTLAHAFFPQNGDLHMDDSEDWTVNSHRGMDAIQTLTHEIGHSLGLDHSRDRSSIMWAYSRPYQSSIKLEADDVRGIQALYGRRNVDDEPDDDYDTGEDDEPDDDYDTGEDDEPDDDYDTGEDDEQSLTRKLQIFLSSSGFKPGKIDGSWGRMTTRALQRYLNKQGANLRVDGDFGRLSVKSLQNHLNSKMGARLKVDGRFGPKTKKALLDFL